LVGLEKSAEEETVDKLSEALKSSVYSMGREPGLRKIYLEERGGEDGPGWMSEW
jgi:hypothetical protein